MSDNRPQAARPRRLFVLLCALATLVLLASAATQRSAGAAPDAAQVAAAAPLPTGDEGDLIAYGRSLITDTQKYAGTYITAGMSCSACHISGGTVAHGGSLLGIYAKFPQWNGRAKRFITLQDRLAECFLYSMNGRPPAYASREMIAMVAYIAFLSRGAEVGKGFPDQGFVTVSAPAPANATAGAIVYTTECASCHGADGAGNQGAFPPLWGPTSFNDGAGMNTKMASFVKSNMPLGRGGTLTDQQAVDVSAFVLSHERPHFDAARGIAFPTLSAGFF